MNPDATLIPLPVLPPQPAAASLVARLAERCDATWVDADSVADWVAGPGRRVLLLAGDAVQFPEGQDVAAVLPELRRSLPGGFAVGIVPRAQEDAVARRYGSQRWPALLCFRDGAYLATVPGMHDWLPFVARLTEALAAPPARVPGIGIPLVSAAGTAPGACH